MASSQHGRFVWYDIASADPQKSIAFYTDVIGWGTQVSTQSDIPYTMLTAGDLPVAGTFSMREGGHAHIAWRLAHRCGARSGGSGFRTSADVDRVNRTT